MDWFKKQSWKPSGANKNNKHRIEIYSKLKVPAWIVVFLAFTSTASYFLSNSFKDSISESKREIGLYQAELDTLKYKWLKVLFDNYGQKVYSDLIKKKQGFLDTEQQKLNTLYNNQEVQKIACYIFLILLAIVATLKLIIDRKDWSFKHVQIYLILAGFIIFNLALSPFSYGIRSEIYVNLLLIIFLSKPAPIVWSVLKIKSQKNRDGLIILLVADLVIIAIFLLFLYIIHGAMSSFNFG